MLQYAIQQMKDVKELAKKVNEQNKKALILKIVEGILYLIPFAGVAAGSLGRMGANLARFFLAIAAAGNGGLAIYSIIEDPSMAPVTILGMLVGSLGTGPKASLFKKMGGQKRDMTTEMKDKMGAAFKINNTKIEAITWKMCGKSRDIRP